MREQITSRRNPLLTQVKKLVARRALRREQGLFPGDGVKLLEEALRWNAPLEAILLVPGVRVPDLPDSVRTVEIPEDVMASISPMETPQGALFLCRMPAMEPPATLAGGRWLVLDGLQDPGNVGTIWRTADALGADGLLLVNGCADPWNPKTVRSSMGACFRLPVYETTPASLAALLERSGLPLYGAALRGDTVDLRQMDLSRCALVVGSEGRGVSPEVLALCRATVKIPMRERCESLNAAAAAAVLLWEMARQDTPSFR